MSEETQKSVNETPEKPKKDFSFYITLVVSMVIMILLKLFILDIYYIPSESMEPTLHGVPHNGGDRVLVDKVGYRFNEPQPGDIVVFHPPENWDQTLKGEVFIKRVIAIEGQVVGVNENGELTVDGNVVEQPYLGHDFAFEIGVLDCTTTPKSQRCFPDVKVPEGSVWLMGDNRKFSMDSTHGCRGGTSVESCQGPVPKSLIVGHARYIVFPFDRGRPL